MVGQLSRTCQILRNTPACCLVIIHSGCCGLHFIICDFHPISFSSQISYIFLQTHYSENVVEVSEVFSLFNMRFYELLIDYGGTFAISRGVFSVTQTFKCYFCLFICVITKARHLEITSDLSSDSFLTAIRRFIARTSRCEYIYREGTNFVGASKQISLMLSVTETQLIVGHFNPLNAPYFGGL